MNIDKNFQDITNQLYLREKLKEKFIEYGIKEEIKHTAQDIINSGFLDVKQAKHCCAFAVVVLENLLVQGKIILRNKGE